MSDFQTITPVKRLRKGGRCHWCGIKLEAGEPGVRAVGKNEGDFYNLLYHPECDEAHNKWWEKYRRTEDYSPEEGSMQRGSIEPKPEWS